MRRTQTIFAIALFGSSAVTLAAGPYGQLTAKHLDEKGDPKEASRRAPKGMWWVGCFVNVGFANAKVTHHAIMAGPWLVTEKGDPAAAGTQFAETFRKEYDSELLKEFPKFAWIPKPLEKGCIVGDNSGDSFRLWGSRDIGFSASRTKFMPSFAK